MWLKSCLEGNLQLLMIMLKKKNLNLLSKLPPQETRRTNETQQREGEKTETSSVNKWDEE